MSTWLYDGVYLCMRCLCALIAVWLNSSQRCPRWCSIEQICHGVKCKATMYYHAACKQTYLSRWGRSWHARPGRSSTQAVAAAHGCVPGYRRETLPCCVSASVRRSDSAAVSLSIIAPSTNSHYWTTTMNPGANNTCETYIQFYKRV